MLRPNTTKRPNARRSELAQVLATCRYVFVMVGVFSGVLNVLMLTGSFYMLQVYDRVIPSRSLPTLLALSLLAGALFAFQGILEIIRGRVLIRIGSLVGEKLSLRVYLASISLPLRTRSAGDSLQFHRDLDQVRTFLSSNGPTAMFDLPWMPIYIAICFIFHTFIGFAAVGAVLLLISIMLLTEMLSRGPTRAASEDAVARNVLAEASQRNVEVLQAMGMGRTMATRWGTTNDKYMQSQQRAADVVGTMSGVSRILRLSIQSAMLGLGAYLAVAQEASAGIMIASAILVSRALAPVELVIASWQPMIRARASWRRLSELLAAFPDKPENMELPRPSASLSVEAVSVNPPGDPRVIVQDVTFRLQAGDGLGVIGPSASGKSSLSRALVGIWTPARGKVRLDGAALDQWSAEARGPFIGYLPQDVELFAGTIAQNISRFMPDAPSEAIIAAAKVAGVHDMVLRLPNGYETEIGDRGTQLSAGQRQRVALARALYGDPFFVVLDEPNSNLDATGEEALTRAIASVRARKGIVILVAHRPSALASIDQLLVMGEGKMQAFGPKEEVLRKVTRPTPAAVPHMKVVSEGGPA